MPPNLRPRPNVPQHAPPFAGKGRISAIAEPQAQSQPPSAAKPTGKPKGRRKKRHVRPSKAEDIQPPKPSQTSKHERANPRARQRIEPQELKRSQGNTERQANEPSEPGSVVLNKNHNSRSRQATHITSWAGQVPEKGAPDLPSVPIIGTFQGLDNYVRSVPLFGGYGYDSSDEGMASSSPTTTDVQSAKKRKPRTLDSGSSKFVMGLANRNIRLREEVDKSGRWLEKVIPVESSMICSAEDELKWKADLMKCSVSDEAIFQRTTMMELINRHHLEDTLDYICESQWSSQFTIPQRDSIVASRMPKPKPDLAVAFKAESLLSDYEQCDLGIYRSVMCPESDKEVKRDRAFHFLSIEVKGASGEISHWPAHRQNFNTATQALYNIYYFMSYVGDAALEDFYNKVRFFSVVATSGIFHVRAHRAIKLTRGRIAQNYPLGFVYEVVHHHDGAGYTKATATGIIRNILVEYGVKVLQPLLAQTMGKVIDKILNGGGLPDEAERQRSRERAASRRSRNGEATSPSSRKTPSARGQDASFRGQDFDALTVNS